VAGWPPRRTIMAAADNSLLAIVLFLSLFNALVCARA
jgi:hypothetical protein